MEGKGCSGFYTSLDLDFPGSLELSEFLDQLQQQLQQLGGFKKENTLAQVCVCRDEICGSMLTQMGHRYGKIFNCSGLGGVLIEGGGWEGAAPVSRDDSHWNQ
eukprot:TRINITY_DN18732_c0_g1_i2.p3 TRINITY_DN18732_c0_g1~~TRINITY_DN18732_c0_g1_i2.p3  ORF type:complete len:103 (+),score=21.65 TRINITY_DN18732_c0_g1_i2:172-480(+)